MAQSEESTLQDMYEYQECIASNGQEYVVRGAKMYCGLGALKSVLNLPKDHGTYTSDGRPLITVNDSGKTNVGGFGYCKALEGICKAELSRWTNPIDDVQKIWDANTKEDEAEVVIGATATCSQEIEGHYGVVAFNSSGQVAPDYLNKKFENAIEIKENEGKDWERENTDFLGHINADHAGVYNLGLNFGNQNYNGGTVFLYKKKKKNKLDYIGAYKILKLENPEKVGFTSNYNNLVEIVLDSSVDYYVEIDCPGMGKINYELIGNIDQEKLIFKSKEVPEDNIIAGFWILGSELETKYSIIYDQYIRENSPGIPTVIMYLDSWYKDVVNDIIETYLVDNIDLLNSGTMADILSLAALAVNSSNVGALLSIGALLVAMLPESNLEKLSKDLRRKGDVPIKLYIYNIWNPDLKYGYDYINHLYSSEIYHFNEYQMYGTTNIHGGKYLKGQFDLYKGFTSNMPRKDLVGSVINELKKIKSDLN